jgi:hypothetical protein
VATVGCQHGSPQPAFTRTAVGRTAEAEAVRLTPAASRGDPVRRVAGMTKNMRALGMMSILMTMSLAPLHAASAFAQFYPLPNYSAPCTDAWVPGY